MTLPPLTIAWAYVALAAVLAISAVTDVRNGKIYNVVTYPAILLGIVGHGIVGWLWPDEHAIGLSGALLGFAVGFGGLGLAWLAGVIGGGDAKLMGAVGALAGWRFGLSSMFYGFIVAAVMAMIVMLRYRILGRTAKRIGRFLFLALMPGPGGKLETDQSPKIPFGLALCIGSALALIEVILRGPASAKLLLGI